MGDPVIKALCMEEQEKLKEKLALLKKEYNRTLSRLQRSQRAERVKARVKKTIEEQNRSLSQESTSSSPAEPPCFASDASGNARESQRRCQASIEGKDREMPVMFNLDPEIFCAQSSTPQCFGGTLNMDCTPVTLKAEDNRDQTPTRSRLKLSRSRKRESSVGSPQASFHLLSNASSILDSPSVCEPGSPVFSKVPAGHSNPILLEGSGATVSLLVPDVKTKKPAGTSTGNNSELELPALLARDPFPSTCSRDSDQSKLPVSLYNRVKGTTDAKSVKKPRNSKFNIQGEQTMLFGSVTNSKPVAAAGTSNDGNDSIKAPQVRKRNTKCKGQKSVEQTHTPIQKEPCLPGEESSPLSSCTLVEGLLFPVEYYVRTTRRMSSCQRKVDLDAVIHSQLSTSRRILRGRSQQGKANNAQDISFQPPSADSFVESGSVAGTTPLSTLGHQPTYKSRGRKRKTRGGSQPGIMQTAIDSPDLKDIPTPVEIPGVTSGSQSEKENYQEQTRSGIDPSFNPPFTSSETEKTEVKKDLNSDEIQTPLPAGQKTLRPHNSAGFPCDALQKDAGNLGNQALTLKASNEDSKCTGSLFPFSSRTSLKRLLSYLRIIDFHLPDDEFGDLKLKKLKTASRPEPCVSNLHKDTETKSLQFPRKDNMTVSPTGQASNLQGTRSGRLSDLESNFKLLKPGESHLNDAEAPAANLPVSTESLDDDYTLTQLSLTPDLPHLLNPSTTFPGQRQDTKVIQSQDLHNVYLSPNQSLKKRYRDAAGQGGTREEQDLSLLPPSVAGQISDGFFMADTQSTFATEGLETPKETQTECEPPIKNPPLPPSFESSLNTNVRSPRTKDDACSVLFSSSICSVPLQTFGEVAASVPGFPVLGSTPAIPPSPLGRDSPLTSRSAKPLTQDVVGTEAFLAGLNGSESMSMGSEGTFLPENNVNKTVSLSGNKCKRCADTELKKECQRCDLCGNPRLRSPVGGIFSQRSSTGKQLRKKPEETILERGRLRLVSHIQDSCGGSCAVDLASSWWDFPHSTDWCILAAGESSVSLWRCRGEDCWEAAHTWNFMKMPVIQIIPLPGEKNMVCVALGNLEIREIWLLFSCPGSLNWEQQIVRRGDAKTVQGLSRCQVAVGSGQGSSQVVEVLQLSIKGSSVRSRTLKPPEDSVLAFCEVEGQEDALLGSTVNSNVVIWNCVTGQLLSTIYVGDLCRDFTCLSASSESGVVFMVLASPYSTKCVFTLIAANPRGAQCVTVTRYTLPGDHHGRYLEGDVKNQKAVAVLTCGNIALWDLSSSQCSALLSPTSDKAWCLVRWAHTSSTVLAGQKNGSIGVYSYTRMNQTEGSDDSEIWQTSSLSGVLSC